MTARPPTGHVISECFPYTTIVGAAEFGYDDKRPAYKRARKGMKAAQAWPARTAACDELIPRFATFVDRDVPIDLRSHPRSAERVDVTRPASATQYKRRDDLLDAAIRAWTAAFRHRYGLERSQVLGTPHGPPAQHAIASTIAPASPEQRGSS